MVNKNDNKIMELKNKIQEKKDELSKISRFQPVTNCNLILDENRYNLNVLDKKSLIDLLIKVNIIKLSTLGLRLEDCELDLKLEDYELSGFKIEDWMTDIRSRLSIISKQDEVKKLKEMENKLTKMLSEDKKTELELKDMEEYLK